jgi:hypothetical protein
LAITALCLMPTMTDGLVTARQTKLNRTESVTRQAPQLERTCIRPTADIQTDELIACIHSNCTCQRLPVAKALSILALMRFNSLSARLSTSKTSTEGQVIEAVTLREC